MRRLLQRGGTVYTIQNQIVFFSKLSADGSALLYSSFLGGTLPVYPNTIGLDASGNMYLSGQVAVLSAKQQAPCADGYQPRCQPNIQFPGVTTSGYQTIQPRWTPTATPPASTQRRS